MGTPQRHRERVVGAGDLVRDGGRRPGRQAGIAVEPAQTISPARKAQPQQRRNRRGGQQEEQAEPDRASDRRQPKPKSKPRPGEENTTPYPRNPQRRAQAL